MAKPDMDGRAGLIVHVITGLGDGGAEGVLYRLCKHDRDHRHVVISLMAGGRFAEPLRALGIPVHDLGMVRGRVGPRAVLRLRRLLRRYRPALVQTWLYHADLFGGLIARLVGIGRISWGIRHGELVPGKSKRSTILIARLCARLSARVPSTIICCSTSGAQAHVDLGYDASKFRVIPNGYEVDQFAPDEIARRTFRTELKVADDMPLLGMVSRYHPDKDHVNFLRAIAILVRQGCDFRVALIGHGLTPDNEELVTLADELGVLDRLRLLGQRNDIAAAMNGIDIHVLSSVSEAFPNVVAEAMLCGTPCVATETGDAALILGDTGWLAPPAESERLADAVGGALAAMADPEMWKQRQHAARQHVLSRFGIDSMVAAYQRAWNIQSTVGIKCC